MKVPAGMLRSFAPDLPDAKRLAQILTAAGLEVESEIKAVPFSGVVIARVRETGPIAGSRNLSLCQVDAGEKGDFQVVCGAPVIETGGLYPLAMPGALLPGDLKIGRRRLAGVESQGMLCSELELQLGEDSDGILRLPDFFQPGQDMWQTLQMDDPVLSLDLTPNRADCFCMEGVARDAAALTATDFQPMQVTGIEAVTDLRKPVEVPAAEDCPRYLCRTLTGIDPRIATPYWLKDQLRRLGQRSLGPVVDVTNYVMLMLGQPLHAFDLKKIGDRIRVRMAENGEQLELLDGSTKTLTEKDLLIADDRNPLALAGIMGGKNSEVSETTTDILLESAFFRPGTIAATARRLSLTTEASRRFERGVSPELQERALERAIAMIKDICGGEAGPAEIREYPEHLPEQRSLELTFDRLETALGTKTDRDAIGEGFARLGLKPQRNGKGWRVEVPAHRFDLSSSEDLIEEAARLIGFDSLPEAPAVRGETELRPATKSLNVILRSLHHQLPAEGWTEVVNYSFEAPELQLQVLAETAQQAAMALASPLAETQSVMRLSLIPGLLQTLHHNLTHRERRLKIFETGRCFRRPAGQKEEIAQPVFLAGLMYGPRHPLSWNLPGDEHFDFYDAKGTVEKLFDSMGLEPEMRLPEKSDTLPQWLVPWFDASRPSPALHGGRSALILVRSGEDRWHPLGWIGCLYPRLARAFTGAAGREVVCFEICLDSLPDLPFDVPEFRPFARFPRIRRDLSLQVPEEISAARLLQAVRKAAGHELVSADIFDLMPGEGGDYSAAIALQWQPEDSTWTAGQIQKATDGILNALKTLNIFLRQPDREVSEDGHRTGE